MPATRDSVGQCEQVFPLKPTPLCGAKPACKSNPLAAAVHPHSGSAAPARPSLTKPAQPAHPAHPDQTRPCEWSKWRELSEWSEWSELSELSEWFRGNAPTRGNTTQPSLESWLAISGRRPHWSVGEQGEQSKQRFSSLLLSLLFSHELNSYLTYLTHSTQRKKRREERGVCREARLRSEQGSEQSEQGKAGNSTIARLCRNLYLAQLRERIGGRGHHDTDRVPLTPLCNAHPSSL